MRSRIAAACRTSRCPRPKRITPSTSTSESLVAVPGAYEPNRTIRSGRNSRATFSHHSLMSRRRIMQTHFQSLTGAGYPTRGTWQPLVEQGSQFVANLPQELLTPFDVWLGFHALGREAIHHAHNSAALGGLGDEYLGRVSGSAVNPANLGYHLDGVEHVDGIKALAEKQDEAVPGTDGQGVLPGQLDHGRVGATAAHEALA